MRDSGPAEGRGSRRVLPSAVIVLMTACCAYTAAVAEVSLRQRCDSGKQQAAAEHVRCVMLAEAANAGKGDVAGLGAAFESCNRRMHTEYVMLEESAPRDPAAAPEEQCPHYGDAPRIQSFNMVIAEAIGDGSVSNGEIRSLSRCGNGVVDGDESCDGNELAGASCASLGFDAGTLECTGGCGFDVGSCTVGERYNCAIGALCSKAAELWPGKLEGYRNRYADDALGEGAAAACEPERWNRLRNSTADRWGSYLFLTIGLGSLCGGP